MRPDSAPRRLSLDIHHQPDDTTCGPTCLHAVYRYFGDAIGFEDVLSEVPTLSEGGTLGVLLATHALARGYRVTIVSWNLQVFDPTWFRVPGVDLRAKLLARAEAKDDPKLRFAAKAYARYLDEGGRIELRPLEPSLLRRFLRSGRPVLTGLSATFLYEEERERSADNRPDDVGGDPVGHFVVLSGYSPEDRTVFITDPLHPNPLSRTHTYPVRMERVVGAIYLGVLTYDANLVVIEPAGFVGNEMEEG